MTDVSVGILGTAHLHADIWAAALNGMDDAELVGFADDNEERGRNYADRHNAEFLDTADLVSRVDAAIIDSPNVDHLDWIKPAAEAGLDILSEKPLMPTVDGCNEAIAACKDAGVELGVAMPMRFSVPAKNAKRALESGAIGELKAISGANRSEMAGEWFAQPEKSGGGAVMDHTVHLVDLVHWITGERVTEVYNENETLINDIDVEDVNILSMELSDGTEFMMDGSWTTPDEWDFWGDVWLEFVGTDGTISFNCFDQTFKRTRDPLDGEGPESFGHAAKETGIERVYWGSDPNQGLIEDFVDAVAEGRSPEITGEEGREEVAVIEAAYESNERSEPVTVTYE